MEPIDRKNRLRLAKLVAVYYGYLLPILCIGTLWLFMLHPGEARPGWAGLLLLVPGFHWLPLLFDNDPRIGPLLTFWSLAGIPICGTFIGVKHFVASEKARKTAETQRKVEEAARLQRHRKEQKEKEIERRKNIVLDINNIYKDTAREVHKTLINTLLYELQDIYDILNSDNLNDTIINGSLTDFQNNINFIKSELQRLKKLALDAQTKGYTDDEKGNASSEESDGKMTKEKAFEIFGIESTATKEEITKAYRAQALKYHTDRWANSSAHIKRIMEEEMKKLNRAKEFFQKERLI